MKRNYEIFEKNSLKRHKGLDVESKKTSEVSNPPVKPCYLCQKYPHTRDKSIKFEDEYKGLEHVYLVDWRNNGEFEVGNNISVSGLYKKYFPSFDADNTIEKMMAGKNWEKSKYFGKSVNEIKGEWNKIGNDASAKGSAHHLKCEQFYNGISIDKPHDIPTCQFLQFAEDHKHLKPFRTEWLLFSDEKHRVCGTPDMLFFSPFRGSDSNNSKTLYLTMFDWKNSKKIRKFNMWEKGYAPFQDLPNCNYYHYAVQLNVYKYMIENFYVPIQVNGVVYDNIEIDKMFLVVMHENRENYLKLLLPNYQDRIQIMFDVRRTELEKITSVL